MRRWNKARIFKTLALGAFLSVIGGVFFGLAIFAWYAKDLPSPDKIIRREGYSTKIYDRNEQLLYDVFNDENRIPVKIEQVPDYLKQATIAVEDKDFYKHGGYDPKGILRAVYVTFKGGRQGGSTLTQQLVKNVLLTQERKLSRKIKEFVLAVQIERMFNKDQILQMYLNETPYGGTAWGVAAASEMYFGKNVSDLNLVESAILAGLPQRPSVYSPYSSTPTAYVDRTKHVLKRMKEDGYITADQEKEADGQIESVEFAKGGGVFKAPHFVFYVQSQLEELYGPKLVEQGGLKVTTTLDLDLQEKAQQIVSDEVVKVANLHASNGAALVMDTQTGEILAMVGSKDFSAKDYDGQVNVTLSKRQPGSSIKPVTYALAFERGYTPSSMLMDAQTEFPGGPSDPPYIPVNYDGKYHGPVQLRSALGSSLNVPAVKLLAKVGIPDMLDLAFRMGFTTLEPTKENLARFGLSVTLGGGEVRMIDMVSAYSAFANGGLKVEPIAILKVEDKDGRVLYEKKPTAGKRVLDEKVAYLMNNVLSDNNARLLTFGENSLLNMSGRPVAVKTGTTNDKRDNWTVGWTSEVIVESWVGNNDNSAMKGIASGVSGASPIWRKIINEVIKVRPPKPFDRPDSVEDVKVDDVSGYPEHDGFPAHADVAIRGTLPVPPDPIHTKLKLCPGQNKLATIAQVAAGDYEEKEYYVFKEEDPFEKDGINKWQEGINAWVASQGDSRYHPPTDQCEGGQAAVVRINKPEHQHNYDGNEIDVNMEIFGDKKVEKLEIVVNDQVRETLTGQPYQTKLTLSPGVYKLKGRAYLEGGDKVESGELLFGMGGVKWEGSNPTPSPTPGP